MIKKILTAFLLIFGLLAGSVSASSFDVSIDRVIVNGKVMSQSSNNLIDDANVFSVLVDFTAVQTLEKAHIEATLRGRQSSDSVSDATSTFDLAKNTSATKALTLTLIDSLKRETEFDLKVKIVDADGSSEQKNYVIKTKKTALRKALDVSIDRVKVNNQVIAASKANFIDESNDFDVLVEFTALEDLEDAHVEAVLKDLNTGNVVADASPIFDLAEDSSSSKLLKLELLDVLKQSNSFELTIKIIDADGNSVSQVYGLRMRDGAFASGTLDISIDSVEVEDDVVAANENNFLVLGEKKDIDVDVRLTSLENVEDAHVDAILTLENGDVAADATLTFDIGKNLQTIKRLELPILSKFRQNSLKLKIRITDADGNFAEKLYGLKISQQKSPFVVSYATLNPENGQAGKSLGVALSFKNLGASPLEDIIATVSIPELGVSSAKAINLIDNKQDLLTQEFVLRIPEDAETGTYTLRSEVKSQFSGQSEVKEIPFFVAGKTSQVLSNEKLVINLPIVKQDMKNDGSEVIFPITFTNKGTEANTYVIMLDGSGWADLRLKDSNIFVLKPLESKTLNVYASTRAKVTGEQIFLVTVKSDDKVLRQLPLKGNATSAEGLVLKSILKAFLILVVVVIAAFGLFVGVRRYFGNNSNKSFASEIPDKVEGEVYY